MNFPLMMSSTQTSNIAVVPEVKDDINLVAEPAWKQIMYPSGGMYVPMGLSTEWIITPRDEKSIITIEVIINY